MTRTLWEILTHRTRPDILKYPKTSDIDAITLKGRRTLYEDINYVFILYFKSQNIINSWYKTQYGDIYKFIDIY